MRLKNEDLEAEINISAFFVNNYWIFNQTRNRNDVLLYNYL